MTVSQCDYPACQGTPDLRCAAAAGTWLQEKAAGSSRAQASHLQRMLHSCPCSDLLIQPLSTLVFLLSRIYTSKKTIINKGKNVHVPCTVQEVPFPYCVLWAAPDSAIPWRISVFVAWEHIMLHAMPCHTPLSPALDTHFRSSIFARDYEARKVFISKSLFRGRGGEKKGKI